MTGTRDEDEDEDVAAKVHKAWWAGRQDAADSFGAGFRAVPGVPHGGNKTVSSDDTAGSMDWCWCGQPFDHDWPGKDDGRRHPRKEPEHMTPTTPTEEQPRIERRALRAYNAELVDVILTAVNEYHAKYRLTAHSVILFPLDGTQPYAINARNGDRQVKPAKQWFVRHIVPTDKPIREVKKAVSTRPVDEEAVHELAEVLNSEEHLPKEEPKAEAPAEKAVAKKTPAKKAPAPPAPPKEEPKAKTDPEPATPEEWMPYVKNKGSSKQDVDKRYLINAKGQVKCVECEGQPIVGTARSTGGHTRTHHTDTTSLWGPDAKKKAIETHFTNKAKGEILKAIGTLQAVIGVEPPKPVDTSPLDAEIKDLKEKNTALKAKNTSLQTELDELKTKLADIETKFALAREAFSL